MAQSKTKKRKSPSAGRAAPKKPLPKIGMVCDPGKLYETDARLIKELSKRFEVVTFPVDKAVRTQEIWRAARGIKLAVNTAGDLPNTFDGMEVTKTLEQKGVRVVDSSRAFYYGEDKWAFYNTCLAHRLPTPETFYIPRTTGTMKPSLREILAGGPIVLKQVLSDGAWGVRIAKTEAQALRAIAQLRKKEPEMPLVAQRYVEAAHKSYRVLLIGNRIAQSVVRSGPDWRSGGKYWRKETTRRFTPSPELSRLARKTARAFGLEWCGIDFVRTPKKEWRILEVNSEPGMDFIEKDEARLARVFSDYLWKLNRRL